MEMKYIVVDRAGADDIFIFPAWHQHDNFAVKICGSFKEAKEKVLAAGFVQCDTEVPPYCYGHSHSLEVESREKDTILLRRYLGWEESYLEKMNGTSS